MAKFGNSQQRKIVLDMRTRSCYNIYMKNRMNIAKWLDTHTPEILARNKAKRKEVYGVLVKHPIFYIALALILVGVFS